MTPGHPTNGQPPPLPGARELAAALEAFDALNVALAMSAASGDHARLMWLAALDGAIAKGEGAAADARTAERGQAADTLREAFIAAGPDRASAAVDAAWEEASREDRALFVPATEPRDKAIRLDRPYPVAVDHRALGAAARRPPLTRRMHQKS